MKIAVVYSIPIRPNSQEYVADADTAVSAREVVEALQKTDADAFLTPIAYKALSTLEHLEADCVFNLIEWTGRDLPFSIEAIRILEKRGVPFTGATSKNFTLTSDKIKAKQALDTHGFPTAAWQVFITGTEPIRKDFPFPAIVKLAVEHCSISLDRSSYVTNPATARQIIRDRLTRYKQPVYLEEFLPGRELHVTLLESPAGILVLPPAEIIYESSSSNFLTFASRWDERSADYTASLIQPAQSLEHIGSDIRQKSVRVFRTFGFRDYARFDIRMKGTRWYFLEINSNPGLSAHEDYAMTQSAIAAGLPFADLVWGIVCSCLRRFGVGITPRPARTV